MPPPRPPVWPPVTVNPCSVRFPEPVTIRMRKLVPFPAMVVWKPFKMIRLVITGSPLPPDMGFVLLAAVRA